MTTPREELASNVDPQGKSPDPGKMKLSVEATGRSASSGKKTRPDDGLESDENLPLDDGLGPDWAAYSEKAGSVAGIEPGTEFWSEGGLRSKFDVIGSAGAGTRALAGRASLGARKATRKLIAAGNNAAQTTGDPVPDDGDPLSFDSPMAIKRVLPNLSSNATARRVQQGSMAVVAVAGLLLAAILVAPDETRVETAARSTTTEPAADTTTDPLSLRSNRSSADDADEADDDGGQGGIGTTTSEPSTDDESTTSETSADETTTSETSADETTTSETQAETSTSGETSTSSVASPTSGDPTSSTVRRTTSSTRPTTGSTDRTTTTTGRTTTTAATTPTTRSSTTQASTTTTRPTTASTTTTSEPTTTTTTEPTTTTTEPTTTTTESTTTTTEPTTTTTEPTTTTTEPTTTTTAPCSAPTWNLVLDEQFNGSSVNGSYWEVYNSTGNAGHGRRQPSAMSVSGGLLTITASMENGTLVSGGMEHRYDQTYGRYEFRVRTDQDASETMSGVVMTWPQSDVHPRDGENNIYETLATPGDRHEFYTFIHKPYGSVHDQDYTVHSVNASSWHTMAMEWTPESIKLYRDGVLVKTINETSSDLIPDVPHHATIQLDAWDDTLPANVQMQVDYLRVYSYEGC